MKNIVVSMRTRLNHDIPGKLIWDQSVKSSLGIGGFNKMWIKDALRDSIVECVGNPIRRNLMIN